MPCLMPQACLWLLYWAFFLGKLKSWKYGIFSPSWSLVLQELVKVQSDKWYNVKEIEGSVHFLVFSTGITYSSLGLWLRSCPLGWWQALFLNFFYGFLWLIMCHNGSGKTVNGLYLTQILYIIVPLSHIYSLSQSEPLLLLYFPLDST